MPNLIFAGVINSNTPQQNAGVWIGQSNISGFDANMKLNMAQGGDFGILSTQINGMNIMLDNFEVIDGVINDQDFKPSINRNI